MLRRIGTPHSQSLERRKAREKRGRDERWVGESGQQREVNMYEEREKREPCSMPGVKNKKGGKKGVE